MVIALVFLIAMVAIYGTLVAGVAWLQRTQTVVAPNGITYRIQMGPRGVPWMSPLTNYDASMSLAPFHLIRFASQGSKTWTVEVRVAQRWRKQPVLLAETFSHRNDAIRYWWDVVAAIKDGIITPTPTPEGGS